MKENIVDVVLIDDAEEFLRDCTLDEVIEKLNKIRILKSRKGYFDLSFEDYQDDYDCNQMRLIGYKKVRVKTEEEIAEGKDLAEYKRLKEKYG